MRREPLLRIRACNAKPPRPEGELVLYWMLAARRTRFNFALDRAVEHAKALGKPLVVLEALRCDHRWASDRFHRFVLDGMADNGRRLSRTAATYFPFVERSPGEGKGLVAALAARASIVVTDDALGFFHPRAVKRAAEQVGVAMEAVDGWGLLPVRASNVAFPTAFAFRRFLQREIPAHLAEQPSADPLAGASLPRLAGLPREILDRWPAADWATRGEDAAVLARIPIDHDVPPSPLRGGAEAAERVLTEFLDERLPGYVDHRNDPDRAAASGLSPYLHFGHLSPHAVLAELAVRESWSASDLSKTAGGRRTGFWGMSPSAEAFLDQLVTWRELGANFCATRDDHDRFDSLPPWAIRTLAEHAADPRPTVYDRDTLESGRTHDALWNAAQRQLREEGVVHNYLRMLWGKKILEWSRSPEEALDVMVELNNRWALDGRDPNSYSGIFWVLGRYDRPWGPERPIFGTVRYMSSANTARKLSVKEYIRRYAPAGPEP